MPCWNPNNVRFLSLLVQIINQCLAIFEWLKLKFCSECTLYLQSETNAYAYVLITSIPPSCRWHRIVTKRTSAQLTGYLLNIFVPKCWLQSLVRFSSLYQKTFKAREEWRTWKWWIFISEQYSKFPSNFKSKPLRCTGWKMEREIRVRVA